MFLFILKPFKRILSESVSKIVDTTKLDIIVGRSATKEELRLVHSEKHVANYLAISPLARLVKNHFFAESKITFLLYFQKST